jgi:hypothetical protein
MSILDRLTVPTTETKQFKLMTDEPDAAKMKISLRPAAGKAKAKDTKKSKAKAKAAPSSKAASVPQAPLKEMTAGLDGCLRKTTLIDDMVNAVSHVLSTIPQEAVNFDFCRNMLCIGIILGLTGEVTLPKKDEDPKHPTNNGFEDGLDPMSTSSVFLEPSLLEPRRCLCDGSPVAPGPGPESPRDFSF